MIPNISKPIPIPIKSPSAKSPTVIYFMMISAKEISKTPVKI